MQTRKINKEFFKKNNLTLSHLNEMLDEQVIEENKFKSMLAALLLGLMPNTKADTLPSNSVTVQNVTNPLLNITDRSATTSQNLLRAKNPNPAEIANIKVKIDADLNKLLQDVFEGKVSDVNVDQYFSMIMAAHGLTEKDPEYQKIKSIAEKLKKQFAIFTMFNKMGGGNKNVSASLANGPNLVQLYYYQKLVSK